MLKHRLWVVAVLALCGTQTFAAMISVGNLTALPNTPGQVLTINATTTGTNDSVQGLNLELQVGNAVALPFNDPALPKITAVSIVAAGTIFASNNVGQTVVESYPNLWEVTTLTSSGTVTASGVVAFITVDTTGIFTGEFDLKVAGTALGTTDFGGLAISPIVNGKIQVPEPSSLALLGLAAVGLIRRRRAA